MVNVVGKTIEDYDSERLLSAVERAIATDRVPIGDAKTLSNRVIKQIERWLTDKTEVTSQELRLQTAAVLDDYDADAAYLYENEKRLF